jgi:phage tail sheath protein FI
MPIMPTYPGVYLEEIPSGVRTIGGVATSITAFIGYTVWGPVDKAIRIFNFGDFERVFGGLDRDSEVSYAVSQFFLNGGTDAYVVRTALGVETANVTLKDTTNVPVLKVSAASPGKWGNNVRIKVNYATNNPDSTFNLYATRYELKDGALSLAEEEQHRNLSLNFNSSTYAERVVNNDSKLVRLERLPNLTFPDKGFTLSGRLNPVPVLAPTDKALDLTLDGKDRVTLSLADPASANDLNKIKAAIEAAAALAGIAARIAVTRSNALGADDIAGEYLKITSQDTTEKSAVSVSPSSSGELATKLKLGLAKGGREKEGASTRRPAPNGTTSNDLADILGTNVSGSITITINDNSTGAPVALITKNNVNLAPTSAGPALRDALQTLIQTIDHPATKNAQVTLEGTALHVVTSASTPNASIVFTDPAGGNGATNTKLTGAGSFVNVQEYALAGGAAFGAQIGSTPGKDGDPPDADTLVGKYGEKTGIYALRDVDLFNLMLIPRTTQLGDSQAKTVLAKAATFCEEERAFLIIDPASDKAWNEMADYVSGLGVSSRNAAIYFPQIAYADPLDGYRVRNIPASGTVAGVIARTDGVRGIWKAPAGTEAALRGAQGLSYTLTDQENGVLNPLGINCLRSFPAHGRIVWGARTLKGADAQADEYKYIPVRRLALYIEESLYRGLQWVVFEPNDEPLWSQIRLNVGAFMQNLFRQGAFQGTSPRDAYFVKCDKETTTQNDINLGIVNIVVGFAPLKPAEFVILKLQQIAGQINT